MINVGVLGARGRMGAEVVKAVTEAKDLNLVAALDLGDSLDELVSAKAQVVVDFTTPDSVMANLEFLIGNKNLLLIQELNHHFHSNFDKEIFYKVHMSDEFWLWYYFQ
jgi:dihydrodipicolinate reductase